MAHPDDFFLQTISDLVLAKLQGKEFAFMSGPADAVLELLGLDEEGMIGAVICGDG